MTTTLSLVAFCTECRFGLAGNPHLHLGKLQLLIPVFLLRHRLSDRQASLCSLYSGLRDAVPAIPAPGWDFVPWGSGLSSRPTADIPAVPVSSLVTEAICTNSAFSTRILFVPLQHFGGCSYYCVAAPGFTFACVSGFITDCPTVCGHFTFIVFFRPQAQFWSHYGFHVGKLRL